MAQRPRLQIPGAVYHVMSRGNRKSLIFLTDDDRDKFMALLAETAQVFKVRVYAACPMGTHYHIVADTPRGNLSNWMRELNGQHSQDFNQKYQHTGHTFEARFHSIIVQRERYLRRVARYVVLNPVKGRLCPEAASWRWTTYRATAGLEPCPPWLYVDWIDWAFKTESRAEAQERYRDYVESGLREPPPDPRGFILGTKRFQQAVIKTYHELREDRPLPRFCQDVTRPPLEHLFLNVEPDFRSRDEAILTAYETHGYRLVEIAKFLGIDPSTASKALKRAKTMSRVHDS